MDFFRISSDIIKKRAPIAPAVFDALSNKKKSICSMKFHRKIWRRKSAIFDPCLVNISVQTHDIDLKILPQLPLISTNKC
jgi:hypothetical protein